MRKLSFALCAALSIPAFVSSPASAARVKGRANAKRLQVVVEGVRSPNRQVEQGARPKTRLGVSIRISEKGFPGLQRSLRTGSSPQKSFPLTYFLNRGTERINLSEGTDLPVVKAELVPIGDDKIRFRLVDWDDRPITEGIFLSGISEYGLLADGVWDRVPLIVGKRTRLGHRLENPILRGASETMAEVHVLLSKQDEPVRIR